MQAVHKSFPELKRWWSATLRLGGMLLNIFECSVLNVPLGAFRVLSRCRSAFSVLWRSARRRPLPGPRCTEDLARRVSSSLRSSTAWLLGFHTASNLQQPATLQIMISTSSLL